MATNYTPEQLLKLGEPSAEIQEVSVLRMRALGMPRPHVTD